MRVFKVFLIIIAAVVVSGIVIVTTSVLQGKVETNQTQEALDPFYTPPNPLVGNPGEIIRTEPIADYPITGATANRILYISKDPAGNLRASGGMVFVPTAPSVGERKVVAYAHGTSGLGDACAPSRSEQTPANQPFIQTLMDLGYVYAATDYVGLGTPGDPYYMVGQSEATDVVNSVRAARNFPGSKAGSTYAVMGHSQGGHSAIWTGELSKQLAPELNLVGVTVSAPATQLEPLLNQQWNTTIGWAIGPEVAISWPLVYPDLAPIDIVTPEGAKLYPELAYKCLTDAGIDGAIQQALGNTMFSQNPATVPAWQNAMREQTPKPLPSAMPVLMNQAIGDGIVLANTNSLTQQKWCAAGSNLQTNWLGQLATGSLASAATHQNTLLAAWPMETDWIQARFDGKPAVSNCGFTPPVKPYTPTASS